MYGKNKLVKEDSKKIMKIEHYESNHNLWKSASNLLCVHQEKEVFCIIGEERYGLHRL